MERSTLRRAGQVHALPRHPRGFRVWPFARKSARGQVSWTGNRDHVSRGGRQGVRGACWRAPGSMRGLRGRCSWTAAMGSRLSARGNLAQDDRVGANGSVFLEQVALS